MKQDRTALMLLGVGGVMHALVAFPNHLLFRTYALDLGLYTHAAWRYAHGDVPDTAMFQPVPSVLFADHMDLYLPILGPLTTLLGTWTLLIAQWTALLAGAWGTWRLLSFVSPGMAPARSGMVLFLFFFGAIAASSFDYHSNVVASCLLPWAILAIAQARRKRAIVLFLLMLVSKENMGFWLGTIAFLIPVGPFMPLPMRGLVRVLGAFCFAYSLLVVGVLMPGLTADGSYAHFDYGLLTGIDWGTPVELMKALFLDHVGVVNGTSMKLEFWALLLLSGGWALVLRPRWGLMALPLLAQKMWNDDPAKWGVFAQYSIEFAPLIAITVPMVLAARTSRWPGRWWAAPLLTMACTVRAMDNTVAYVDHTRIRFYQVAHYERTYDLDVVRMALATIPPDAVVSAQSPAVPQLALRARILQFPIIADADRVLLLPQEGPYPLDVEAYDRRMKELLADPSWAAEFRTPDVVLLRRVKP